ncbi:ParA family protein [Sorangium sp. So ce1335]|uniref:ParA family protein n=1 Tax=Sorangium sp. So ce1335 TaxID=3133335 RepID=UPI003F605F9A
MAYAPTGMPDRPKQSVLAVQNIKGGVGKTTIAVNLAALLAERHHRRVLLIDADPQCNASLYLLSDQRFEARTREDKARREGNLHDLFHGDVRYFDVVSGKPHGPLRKVSDYLEPVRTCAGGGSLTLVCGSARMFEVQEIAAEIVVSRIKKWLPRAGGAYEHVVIDCPPSISSVSLAALKAADKILVPMTADQFSLHGLPLLMRALREYKKVLDIKAKVAGVVLSMFPPSSDAVQRAKAERYVTAISDLCAAQKPAVRCLSAVISRDEAYRDSFERNEPLPFSGNPDHVWLIDELEAVAQEVGLLGGAP